MPLARAWWRGSAWALAATLVVPGALAIAVATIALGGGLRSLGAVAQIVNGPEVPEAQLSDQAASRTTSTARPTRLPSVPRTAGTPSGTSALQGPAGTVAPGIPRRSAGSTPGSTTGPSRPVTRRPSTGSAPAASSAPATNNPPSNPGPGSSPDDPIRQAGKAAAGTVGSAVPAPVGPAAADAVTTVLDLVDPPKAAAAVAP